MKYYLFSAEVDIIDICIHNQLIAVHAKNKEQAVMAARVLMLDWWGVPEDWDADNLKWLCINSNGDITSCIDADPEFKAVISQKQFDFLDAVCNVVKLASLAIRDNYIMEELQEVADSCNAELDSGMLATLFGETIAARATIELQY